jgi:uroporphyrinogen decarboxylase
MSEMTSRERVKATFGGRIPDRVPINYFSNPALDGRLKQHFRLAPKDDEGLRCALGVDFRCVGAPYTGKKLHADVPGRSVDDWGVHRRWVEHGAGGYWDFCDFPLKDATLEEVECWAMPSPDDHNYQAVAEQCARYPDHAIVAGNPGVGDIINSTGFLRSMEQVLVDLLSDDDAGLRLIDRKTEIHYQVMRRTLEAARGRVDVLWIGEDLGTQIGPILSLDLYRQQIRPRQQRFVDLGKEFGIPVMIHSCGSSSWAFEDFVAMGIKVVDTLQPEAKDMAPAYLKQRYGGRLAFHGCVSTAGPVSFGTPTETAEDVRRTLEVMMPGGGYAMAPTHSLQDNSPTENVVAMYEAVRKYGSYGKR